MPLVVGERAPAFRLRGIDNAHWILGEPDKRRCVLIAFFARESAPCRIILPFIERLHRRARVHEAEIMGVSLDNQSDTLEFSEDYSITFPILIEGPERETIRAFRVRALPTIYRLDESLRVAEVCEGWSRSAYESLARAWLEAAGARLRSVWESNDLTPDPAAATPILDPRLG